jgi:hypothetical protein
MRLLRWFGLDCLVRDGGLVYIASGSKASISYCVRVLLSDNANTRNVSLVDCSRYEPRWIGCGLEVALEPPRFFNLVVQH